PSSSAGATPAGSRPGGASRPPTTSTTWPRSGTPTATSTSTSAPGRAPTTPSSPTSTSSPTSSAAAAARYGARAIPPTWGQVGGIALARYGRERAVPPVRGEGGRRRGGARAGVGRGGAVRRPVRAGDAG